MIDGATLHVVYPGGGTKRLSRAMGVPLNTIRSWFYKHLSASRQRELAAALLAEMDRQEPHRAALRQHLTGVVRGEIGGAVGEAVAGDRGIVAGRQDRDAKGG